MDILEMLEASAKEIRDLRGQVESMKLMRANQTLRIAVSQIRGHKIDWKSAGDVWEKLRALIDDGRVTMDHACEVYLDNRVLTRDTLNDAC